MNFVPGELQLRRHSHSLLLPSEVTLALILKVLQRSREPYVKHTTGEGSCLGTPLPLTADLVLEHPGTVLEGCQASLGCGISGLEPLEAPHLPGVSSSSGPKALSALQSLSSALPCPLLGGTH